MESFKDSTEAAYNCYYDKSYPPKEEQPVKTMMKEQKRNDKIEAESDTLRQLAKEETNADFTFQEMADELILKRATDFDREIMVKQIEDRKKKKSASVAKKPKKNYLPPPDPDLPSPYGYVYMPNRLWRSNQYKPPVCYSNTTNIVQPVYTSGYSSSLLEFTGLGSILPTFEFNENPGDLREKKYFDSLNKQHANQWVADSRTVE